MGRSAFGQTTCRMESCDHKRISTAGFAMHAHMMSHVRKGELVCMHSYAVGKYGYIYVKPERVEDWKAKGMMVLK